MKNKSLPQDLVIVGGGGLGREVKWLIDRINQNNIEKGHIGAWNLLGFMDDGLSAGTLADDIPILGNSDWLLKRECPTSVTCAIGSSSIRKKVVEKLESNKMLEFPNLIDPSIIMSERIKMGKGNILCVGGILTVDITIGDFIILNPMCTIAHDVNLDSFVTLYPSAHLSGCVHVGMQAEIGTGCHVIQGKSIGKKTFVGAGAVVIRDLPDNCTAVGNPAKVIKFHNA